MQAVAKQISWRQNAKSVLLWSIISAAFIGPGTVTTAATAGADFGTALIWALIFSIAATIVLQEAAARLNIASGKSLGEILALKYSGKKGKTIKIALFVAIAFGCAAYQMGNLLGAVSGLALILEIELHWLTLGVAILCAFVLWKGSLQWIARTLGLVVALMGLFFIYIAFQTPVEEFIIAPPLSEKAAFLVVALIGTTIVPYNLFLATGIGKGQSIREMRWGLFLAVLIGGGISIAILWAGTQVVGEFTFEGLSQILTERSGKWSSVLFAFGLGAAGLSSAITAPFATAVTAQSLFATQDARWQEGNIYFRTVSLSILGIGLFFALLNVKPVPAIILAQAINGFLLPIVAVFLLLMVNDTQLLPKLYRNNLFTNVTMLLIVGVTVFLGIYNLLSVAKKGLRIDFSFELLMWIGGLLSLVLMTYLSWRLFKDVQIRKI